MCASDSVWRIAVAKKRKLLAALGMSSVRASASEFLKVALNQIRNPQKNRRPVRRGHLRPPCKCFFRCSDGEIDIARITVSDLRIGLSCSRLDVVEIFAADRVNELSFDEVLNFLSRLCHVERSRDILYTS